MPCLKKNASKNNKGASPYTTAILLAGGEGVRMGKPVAKQWLEICGKPVFVHTLTAFNACPLIDEIIVVVSQTAIEQATEMLAHFPHTKPICIVIGGDTRQASAKNGFLALSAKTEYIAIHDVARLLITPLQIESVVREAYKYQAASAGTKVTDTIKKVEEDFIAKTYPRETLWLAQTPQICQKELYTKALASLDTPSDSLNAITDDNMLLEHLGVKIKMVDTGRENIKITTASDLLFAESILVRRQREASNAGNDYATEAETANAGTGTTAGTVATAGTGETTGTNATAGTGETTNATELDTTKGRVRSDKKMRIGHGYDVHRYIENRPLILGGVSVPYAKGLLGHSDADVLTHAIMDALLGAAGLPNIGVLYSDKDEQYRGISSLVLACDVAKRIAKAGYSIGNIDATVIAQEPKLAPYIEDIRLSLAQALSLDVNRINLKATTEENLGFTGRLEGVSAHAVCLLFEK